VADEYIVKPVYKALVMLQAIGEAGRDLSLREVCELTGLPKSTAYKYLRTMRECGFLAHDELNDTYRIGPMIWQLGESVDEQQRLRETALPLMNALRDRFDETVNLGVLDRTEVVYLEMVESAKTLRMRAHLGGRDPVYSTGLGKALLAALPDDSWRQHLPPRLTPRTKRTVTSFAALQRDIDAARERGYAVEHGENEDDGVCMAAPIRDATGRVLAAISVAAPANRVDTKLERSIGVAVRDTAAAISERLGYRVP
jgi:IclR family transcriptional regulator, KDG regulon repressor